MPKVEDAYHKIQRICLSLPDTKETLTWGKPHFRVGEKIFAGYGDEGGKATVGFKLEMTRAAKTVKRPGFTRAPYVGHKGWVSLDVAAIRDWDEVRDMILESYRLIAPKRSLAKLDGERDAPSVRAGLSSARSSSKRAGLSSARSAASERPVKSHTMKVTPSPGRSRKASPINKKRKVH